MTTANLKQELGEAGRFLDRSHGSDNLYDVLKSLATSGGSYLNGETETPTVTTIARMVAAGPMYLKSLSANLEDTGSADPTTIVVEVGGVIKATVVIDDVDADDLTHTTTLAAPFLVPAGVVVVMKITTIGTAMSGLAASAYFSPLNVE